MDSSVFVVNNRLIHNILMLILFSMESNVYFFKYVFF